MSCTLCQVDTGRAKPMRVTALRVSLVDTLRMRVKFLWIPASPARAADTLVAVLARTQARLAERVPQEDIPHQAKLRRVHQCAYHVSPVCFAIRRHRTGPSSRK